MVIIYLYDEVNGYRYRKISRNYYEQVFNNQKINPKIVASWFVPD